MEKIDFFSDAQSFTNSHIWKGRSASKRSRFPSSRRKLRRVSRFPENSSTLLSAFPSRRCLALICWQRVLIGPAQRRFFGALPIGPSRLWKFSTFRILKKFKDWQKLRRNWMKNFTWRLAAGVKNVFIQKRLWLDAKMILNCLNGTKSSNLISKLSEGDLQNRSINNQRPVDDCQLIKMFPKRL